MAYQYQKEQINPFKVPYFNSAIFWTLVYSDDAMDVSFNKDSVPLFKINIDKDYYFIFGAVTTVNNLVNVHVCVGNCILNSFKIEFDYGTMSTTRKLIAEGDYNFSKLFLTLSSHPLLIIKPSLNQIMSILSKFNYAVTFKFNAADIDESYRQLTLTVNFLKADEFKPTVSSVSSKYYIIYFMDDGDVAFEKQVDKNSEFGVRLSRFVKFTKHDSISVGASIDDGNVYFFYKMSNICGIIKADMMKKLVIHTRKLKESMDVTVINDPEDMDSAFFGVFNRYFADSLVNYPSKEFMTFAEQYGLDIQHVSGHDCLTLVDMVTV